MKKQIVAMKKDAVITSLEACEMVEMTHDYLLKKIDGRTVKGVHKKGYREIIADGQMSASDFFIPSEYKDESGKKNKCYLITYKGCEFLAHKFTGEKGVIFTARYINRFHEMEQEMARQQTPRKQIPMQSPTEAPRMADWYSLNRENLNNVCKLHNINRTKLYHIILTKLGESFDLKACRKIYQKEKGYPPSYAMDIVPYFRELQTAADKIIKDLECPFYFDDDTKYVCPFD